MLEDFTPRNGLRLIPGLGPQQFVRQLLYRYRIVKEQNLGDQGLPRSAVRTEDTRPPAPLLDWPEAAALANAAARGQASSNTVNNARKENSRLWFAKGNAPA